VRSTDPNVHDPRGWDKSGTLDAGLGPALILTPPPGREVGYVPIATRQELEGTPGE
jgi:hypothetical protein